jgi:hypothetical protein
LSIKSIFAQKKLITKGILSKGLHPSIQFFYNKKIIRNKQKTKLSATIPTLETNKKKLNGLHVYENSKKRIITKQKLV